MRRNPYDVKDKEELREIAFYWLQRCHRVDIERKALLEILSEKHPDLCYDVVFKKMNEIESRETERWLDQCDKSEQLKKKLTNS
jgi:hypothetical protein